MKKFIIKSVYRLLQILFVVFVLKFFLMNFNKRNYLSNHIDKIKKLQSLKGKKKIVIIGTSSAAFGISAKQFSDSFKMDAINLGVHGGLGIFELIKFASLNTSSQDIIIIQPDFGFLHNPLWVDFKKVDELKFQNPKYNLLNKNYLDFALSIFTFSIDKDKDFGTYKYNIFNKYGDLMIPKNCNPEFFKYSGSRYEDNLNIDLISDVVKDFFGNRRIFLSFPPIHEQDFELNKSNLKKLEGQLQLSKKFTLLNSLETSTFPHSSFFDGPSHLKYNEREKRTKAIISNLKRVL
jgi:hypothetical protein